MDYFTSAEQAKQKLETISPSMCMAKWLQVSLHLPQGRTHSCYHPPTHRIPLDELEENVNALHNTKHKMLERLQMLSGDRPEGCQYCWNIEDAPNGPHLSDRHYRSSEWWAQEAWDEVVNNDWDYNIQPRYVEVNFNQACNFKCSYCSPHLSTAWEDDIKEHGQFEFSIGSSHNDIAALEDAKLMPLKIKQSENPYVDAFWQWWPQVYPTLRVFRMTGGEPLMDKNTFRVFDYIIENPNPDLEISLTTNMCPPNSALFDKFIEKIKRLDRIRLDEDYWKSQTFHIDAYKAEPDPKKRTIVFYVQQGEGNDPHAWPEQIVTESLQDLPGEFFATNMPEIDWEDIPQKFSGLGQCDDADDLSYMYTVDYEYQEEYGVWLPTSKGYNVKRIQIFISVDSWGTQAEYIRDGLDWETMKRNTERLLNTTQRLHINFINTFNILSVPGLRGFLEYVQDLRLRHGFDTQCQRFFKHKGQRVWFDTPYLRYPDWMTIQLCDDKLLQELQNCIDFAEQHVLDNDTYGRTYQGFKNYEVAKLKRDLAWAQEGDKLDGVHVQNMKIKFYEYFNEYDRRRNKNFLQAFPEMQEYWEECKLTCEEYNETGK